MAEAGKFYVTTPIYYVNDRPHIGHVYTTLVADVVARLHRLRGEDVFFLTGTDEHAAKVVDSATEQGLSAQELADRNAAAFEETFSRLGASNDDFIRTSEDRHKRCVERLIEDLVRSDDVHLGEYEGWYDAGEEEYVPENRAAEHDYKSPVSGKPLVRRKEENYFFRLSRYQEPLLELLETRPEFVQPAARRNEVMGRIRQGLLDVPISRAGAGEWGVRFPGQAGHLVYVWIDALVNYISAVEGPERRRYWPADVHLIAKDILWFHAVIWPAMLLALQKTPGNEWIRLPGTVYAHSWWIHEGQKMSKSLGNFIDLEKIDHYVESFGLDALRYFLATQGPIGTVDSDFTEARFIEVYQTDLANAVGNCLSRIVNMTHRFLEGRFETVAAGDVLRREAERLGGSGAGNAPLELDRIAKGVELVRRIDAYIEATQPFKLAKQAGRKREVAAILYECAETFRIASLWLWPAMPGKMEEVWRRLGLGEYGDTLRERGRGRLEAWCGWGGLPAGTQLDKGPPLFPRYDPA
jgi:methionyl-tRNA synthetase